MPDPQDRPKRMEPLGDTPQSKMRTVDPPLQAQTQSSDVPSIVSLLDEMEENINTIIVRLYGSKIERSPKDASISLRIGACVHLLRNIQKSL